MFPLLDHSSTLENEDRIGFFDGLEAVRDYEDRTSLEKIMERLADLLFRKTIERGGRLVKQNDVRILEKYLRDGETLFLSSGKLHPPLPYLGIKTFR